LPIRIHDLLLSLAGRVDDDALADVRQMLASAELDRSLEFLAGCLAAGRIVLTSTQHHELESLFTDTYLDPSVIDRVMVSDRDAGRHRFAVGSVDGLDPARGVADAVRPVLDVLPDVRSMWCVWRLTPAGPASGPVPHLLVLVGIGPGGFPPATAYRVEHALRRAGIRASVEVLMDGVEPGEYHREAMRYARQLPFDGHGSSHPRVEPADRQVAFEAPRAEPARIAPSRVEPPRLDPPRVSAIPPEPPRISPEPRPSADPFSDSSRFVADQPGAASSGFGTAPSAGDSARYADHSGMSGGARQADQVTDTSIFAADQTGTSADRSRFGEQPGTTGESRLPADRSRLPAAPPEPPRADQPRAGVDAPRIDSPHVELPVRKDPPFAVDPQVQAPFSMDPPRAEPEPPRVDPPTTMTPAAGGLVGPGGLVGGAPDVDQDPPPRIDGVRSDPFTNARPAPEFEQERTKDEPPAGPPPSALRDETRTDSAPPPRRARADKDDEPQTKEHPSRPTPAPANGSDKHSQAFVDDILNTQERNLLRELQDELARREQQDTQPPIGNNSGPWRMDRSGRHGKPAAAGQFDHPNQTTGPMIINGVPPHPDKRGYPPAN
jgi:hypothetical protein